MNSKIGRFESMRDERQPWHVSRGTDLQARPSKSVRFTSRAHQDGVARSTGTEGNGHVLMDGQHGRTFEPGGTGQEARSTPRAGRFLPLGVTLIHQCRCLCEAKHQVKVLHGNTRGTFD
jgi:hypothetical protein